MVVGWEFATKLLSFNEMKCVLGTLHPYVAVEKGNESARKHCFINLLKLLIKQTRIVFLLQIIGMYSSKNLPLRNAFLPQTYLFGVERISLAEWD